MDDQTVPEQCGDQNFQGNCAISRPRGGCRGPKGRGSRCEAARAAIRFGGLVRDSEDVLKCTIAPVFDPKETPSSVIFLSLPPCRPQGACGGWLLAVHDSLRLSRIGGRLPAVFNNNNPYLLLLISPTAGAVLLCSLSVRTCLAGRAAIRQATAPTRSAPLRPSCRAPPYAPNNEC